MTRESRHYSKITETRALSPTQGLVPRPGAATLPGPAAPPHAWRGQGMSSISRTRASSTAGASRLGPMAAAAPVALQPPSTCSPLAKAGAIQIGARDEQDCAGVKAAALQVRTPASWNSCAAPVSPTSSHRQAHKSRRAEPRPSVSGSPSVAAVRKDADYGVAGATGSLAVDARAAAFQAYVDPTWRIRAAENCADGQGRAAALVSPA